ncbi:MAG: choice-of-anchor J domain-containing protein, partial [Flavobacteriales bacterium]|nr:choice-of-anchor J domain-containing protein [Flavobacteriales bacterium]
SAGSRNNLWKINTLNLTGTADGFSNVCVPVLEFSHSNASGCEGLEVDFEDNSWNANVDESWVYSWVFEGGTPATSNEQNPTVTYNTAGTFDVTFTITNSEGSVSETLQNTIVVTSLTGNYEESLSEGVEDSDFPENADPNLNWAIEAGSNQTWRRNTTAAFSGDASVRINLRAVAEGVLNHLISPPLDFSDVEASDAKMTFRMAHAKRTSDGNERLRVQVSKNCGESWTLRYSKSGNSLSTNGGNNVTSTFVPNQNDWREETVSLSSMAGEQRVLIRFEARSDNQNYLYLDDINIGSNISNVGIKDAEALSSVNVFPNPISGLSYLEISATESADVEIDLTNVIGQTMGTKKILLTNGLNRILVSDIYNVTDGGIYFITVKTDSGAKTLKLIKN